MNKDNQMFRERVMTKVAALQEMDRIDKYVASGLADPVRASKRIAELSSVVRRIHPTVVSDIFWRNGSNPRPEDAGQQ